MEAPERLELKAGEQHLLRLKGSGSAGYRWDYVIHGSNNIVTIERKNSEIDVPKENIIPHTYSRDTFFLIHALSSGMITVEFTLHRPWIKDEISALKKYTVEILIRE